MKTIFRKKNFILPIVAMAAAGIMIPSVAAESVSSEEAFTHLKECITDTSKSVCTLEGDITNFNEAVAINSSKEINLNNHSIKGEGKGGGFFGINPSQTPGVKVKITGTGTIEYTGEGTPTSIPIYGASEETIESVSNLTIDSGVTIKNIYVAFFVRKNATLTSYGASLDLYGKIEMTKELYYPIYVQGNIHNATNSPTINIYNGASVSTNIEAAIMQAGCANTTIHGGTITGETGIGIKSCNLNVLGGTITGTSTNIDAENDESGQDVIVANGAAIQVKSTQGDYGNVNINIKNGTLKSEHNSTITEYIYSSETSLQEETKINSIKISGGNFIAPTNIANISGSQSFNDKFTHFISGGKFSNNIAASLLVVGTLQTSDGIVMTEEAYAESIKPKETDKTKLNSTVLEAKDKLTDGSKYTDETMNALKEAIANAEKVINDSSATEEEVAAAIKAVNDALLELKEIVEICDNVTVAVAGEDIEIIGSVVEESTETYNTMKNMAKDKGYDTLFDMYEFHVKDNKTLTKSLTITFNIGEENNGKLAYILHQKHNGSYEEFERVVEHGKVLITVSELSPFLVALKDKEPEKETIKDENTGSNNAQTSSMDIFKYGMLSGISLIGFAALAIKMNKKSN